MKRFSKKDLFPLALLSIFAVIWLVLSISPRYRGVWLVENSLTVVFLVFLVLTYRLFRLSNLSYSLLFVYLLFHTVGSYYSYSEVPLFSYIKEFFLLSRNHYDRLLHFLFGLFFFLPLSEVYLAKTRLPQKWVYFFSFMTITALKGIFELMEYGWILLTKDVVIAAGYLGMQGDVWDAQKDIFWGMIGAGIAWIWLGVKKTVRR